MRSFVVHETPGTTKLYEPSFSWLLPIPIWHYLAFQLFKLTFLSLTIPIQALCCHFFTEKLKNKSVSFKTFQLKNKKKEGGNNRDGTFQANIEL